MGGEGGHVDLTGVHLSPGEALMSHEGTVNDHWWDRRSCKHCVNPLEILKVMHVA